MAVAVTREQRQIARLADPYDRAAGYGQMLAELHYQIIAISRRRDEVIVELLRQRPRPSHRDIAVRIGVGRQRVDQLARALRDGSRGSLNDDYVRRR